MDIDAVIKTVKETNLTSLTRTTFDYSFSEGVRSLIIKELVKQYGSGNNKYQDISRGPHEQKSVPRSEFDRE